MTTEGEGGHTLPEERNSDSVLSGCAAPLFLCLPPVAACLTHAALSPPLHSARRRPVRSARSLSPSSAMSDAAAAPAPAAGATIPPSAEGIHYIGAWPALSHTQLWLILAVNVGSFILSWVFLRLVWPVPTDKELRSHTHTAMHIRMEMRRVGGGPLLCDWTGPACSRGDMPRHRALAVSPVLSPDASLWRRPMHPMTRRDGVACPPAR